MKTTPLRNFTPRKSAGGGDQTAPRLDLLLLKIPRVPRGIDQMIKLLFINNNSISASATPGSLELHPADRLEAFFKKI
jgi:hypothetical protein